MTNPLLLLALALLLAASGLLAQHIHRRHTPRRRLRDLWRRIDDLLQPHALPEGTLSVEVRADGTLSLHSHPKIPAHLRLALLAATEDALARLPRAERGQIEQLYFETGPSGAAFGNRMHVIRGFRPPLLVGRQRIFEGASGGGWKD